MTQAQTNAIDGVLSGDRRAIARAISAVENETDESHALRAALAGHVGRAHVIGVTGPPGSGKSTLVSALIKRLLVLGRRVGVVAVDPSSPISGGAVLGDRIRMAENQADERVFIRSLASRGHPGGLSRTAAQVVDVLDASGFDIVIVETVGAGQSEVEIVKLADTRLVVCPPGLGDEVQAIKAGLFEIADAFVVTKADLPDADRTEADLQSMLALRRGNGPTIPTMKTIATSGEGFAAVVDWLQTRKVRGTRLAAPDEQAARMLAERLVAADGFARHLGLELIEAAPGRASVRMHVGEQHINFNGRCHGGAIFSLADTALGLACNLYGSIATLVDGHISLSSSVTAGEWLTARATEVSRTRRFGVYRIEVTRGPQRDHVAMLSGRVYRMDKPIAALQPSAAVRSAADAA